MMNQWLAGGSFWYFTILDIFASYPLVNWHSNGISPFLIGNTSSKGPFSIAMLVYRRVLSLWIRDSYIPRRGSTTNPHWSLTTRWIGITSKYMVFYFNLWSFHEHFLSSLAILGGGFKYFFMFTGKWSNLTNIFQRGWNHQLELVEMRWTLFWASPGFALMKLSPPRTAQARREFVRAVTSLGGKGKCWARYL